MAGVNSCPLGFLFDHDQELGFSIGHVNRKAPVGLDPSDLEGQALATRQQPDDLVVDLVDVTPEPVDSQRGHQQHESLGIELRTGGLGGGGTCMDFDDDSVCPHPLCCQGQRLHPDCISGGVRGIDDHGEVRQFLEMGNSGDIEHVRAASTEGTNAPLHQYDLLVAFGQQVFGRPQPLVEGGRGTAPQQHWFAQPTDHPEELEVLHAARADLKGIDLVNGILGVLRLENLGDNRETDLGPGGGKHPHTVATKSPEAIRSGAGFVSAGPQDGRSGFGYGVSR